MRRCLSPFICTIFNHFTSTTFKIKISSMGTYEIILYLIVGGIIGFFLGRLAFKSKFSSYLAVLEEKSSAKDLRIQELQDTISSLNAQIGELQNRLQAEMQTRAAAEERAARVPELNEQLSELQEKLDSYNRQIIALQKQSSELETQLKKEREAMEEKIALLNEAKEKLTDAFKALSAEALRSSSEEFLKLARTRLETFQKEAQGELEKRKQAVEELVKPVKETLERFDSQVQQMEKERIMAYQDLKTQIEQLINTQTLLRNETANLVKALGTPKVRGKWGELQLRRVVELAGMVNYCDFTEQVAINAEEGRLIPDLIVHLPGGRDIVIDAKTPLGAYLEAISEVDEEKRKKMLEHHARQIREHMDKLSKKSYWQQFTNVPEFVVLFLPGEIFFSAALEQDPSLIEYGVDQKIIIATPTTLIALLKAVAYGWKQQSLAENAQRISELGTELYSRLISMSEHLAKLGSSLESAVKSYNNAIGSFETRVLVQARKFKELGASKGDREIESLIDIEVSPRQLRAEENHNK